MRVKTIMVWILILEIRNWRDHTLKAMSFNKNNHKCFGNRYLEAILGLKLIHNICTISTYIFTFTNELYDLDTKLCIKDVFKMYWLFFAVI